MTGYSKPSIGQAHQAKPVVTYERIIGIEMNGRMVLLDDWNWLVVGTIFEIRRIGTFEKITESCYSGGITFIQVKGTIMRIGTIRKLY